MSRYYFGAAIFIIVSMFCFLYENYKLIKLRKIKYVLLYTAIAIGYPVAFICLHNITLNYQRDLRLWILIPLLTIGTFWIGLGGLINGTADNIMQGIKNDKSFNKQRKSAAIIILLSILFWILGLMIEVYNVKFGEIYCVVCSLGLIYGMICLIFGELFNPFN
jgi:hypothetical protein